MSKNSRFSFPKAPRFPSLRQVNDIPFYNIPSTIKKRSISLGERLPIKNISNTPSPQHYALQDTKSQMKKTFGIGRDRMYQPMKSQSQTPGPQVYKLPNTLKKISYSIRPRLKLQTESSITPGPGTYHIDVNRLKTIF
ncbi:unnamed protein product [Paramecium primaurelia]|uniref:Uncharacterized protein n=1 Tax=Paramecium primaurelia TaxID=5886 RepID=A0A8S1LK25_PARPR|nr:unnamed protein product [Paramecium primaurelia]